MQNNPNFRFTRMRKSGKTEFFEVNIERAVITHLIKALFVIFHTFWLYLRTACYMQVQHARQTVIIQTTTPFDFGQDLSILTLETSKTAFNNDRPR